MNKRYSLNFPWLGFLWSTIFWSLIVMLILGVAFWYFGRDILENLGLERPLLPSLFSSLLWDVGMTLLILVPCFYAGMGACVYLERRGGRYEKQFETTFRATSTVLFLAILMIYLVWHLIPLSQASPVDIFNTIRLIIIYYIFDANVSDRVWTDIFEKR